jgi:ABC-type methionine transport system permease subunit
LHDTGIIGFALLTLFILIKSINRIKTILRVNRFNYNLKYFFAFPFINLLIELFPLKSTGSLFGTWQGSLTWLILALALYNMKKIKNSDISKK